MHTPRDAGGLKHCEGGMLGQSRYRHEEEDEVSLRKTRTSVNDRVDGTKTQSAPNQSSSSSTGIEVNDKKGERAEEEHPQVVDDEEE